MSKVVVCRCEDVLLNELEDAIRAGNEDIESLKRYTGFGTGVCQGKSCVAHVARILAEQGGVPTQAIQPFTPRPPVAPVPLRLLAAEDEIVEPPIRGGAR
jgi:sarcosine oxidase subunit beta